MRSPTPNKALVYCLLRPWKYHEAEELLRQAIATRKKVMGPKHESVAIGLAVLASVYLSDGRENLAAETITEAVVIYSATHMKGGALAGRALLLYQSGASASQQDNFEKAEPLLRESTKLFGQLFGRHHPLVAWAKHDHGRSLMELGRNKEAIKAFEEVFEITHGTVRKSHPKLFLARMSLAALYFSENKYEKASSLLEETIDLTLEECGRDSIEYAKCLRNKVGITTRY